MFRNLNVIIFLFPTIFGFSLMSNAESAKVKAVKGNRVLVETSVDSTLAVGEAVNLTSESEDEMNVDSPSPKKALRKRTHGMSWRYSSYSMETQIQSSTTKTSGGELHFIYGYNFGTVELGVTASSSYAEAGTSKSTATSIGPGLHINFIENKPGNDFIPYVYLALLSRREESGGINLSATGTQLGLGLSWFPFSEIFTLSAGLTLLEKYTFKYNSSDVNVSATGLQVGWGIYF